MESEERKKDRKEEGRRKKEEGRREKGEGATAITRCAITISYVGAHAAHVCQ
jgi:hypothetical protein